PTPMKDLPAITGVAPETLKVMLGVLERSGHLSSGKDGRARTVRLTARGVAARRDHDERVAATERAWDARFGPAAADLRDALVAPVGDPTLDRSPLRTAVAAPPGCWRADERPRATLPHHPVVSHRGGYPDGS